RAAANADASWYREEPALYLCPECGSFVGKGANACPFCGVVFDEGEAAAPPSPVEELLQARNGEAKICTRCGAFLEPGATACGMCGSQYTPERVADLPAVDTTPLPDPDLFLCPRCGAFLSQADAIASFDRAARVDSEHEDLYRIEALGLLGPAPDLSPLPPRWKPAAAVDELDLDLEDTPRAPPAPKVPPTVAPAIAPASRPK